MPVDFSATLRSAPNIVTPIYDVRLWRADMVTSVIEVDANGLVVEGDSFLSKLYPSGRLWDLRGITV